MTSREMAKIAGWPSTSKIPLLSKNSDPSAVASQRCDGGHNDRMSAVEVTNRHPFSRNQNKRAVGKRNHAKGESARNVEGG